ncbi:MAG: hypothetical protein HC888_04955 [Candidatus Competibacteraceae bacterium]|nr:hypothetical protein [Candidatus Competibacteraceae bacterium]
MEQSPAEGFRFFRWEGDPAIAGSTGSNLYANGANLSANTRVTARFAPCGTLLPVADLMATLWTSAPGTLPIGWYTPEGSAGAAVVAEELTGSRLLTTAGIPGETFS